MHILIGLIAAVAGLIWALYRLQNAGVDLNAFNPFYWFRRRKWEKQLGVKPIHRLGNSMEAAALLVVAAATLEGSITRELKQEVLALFCSEFGISEHSAQEHFAAASYLLKDVMNISAEVKNILAPSIDQFQDKHKHSLVKMIEKVISLEGAANDEQQCLLTSVQKELTLINKASNTW